MNDFQELMAEICQELHIKLSIISNGWIYVLEKDGVRHFTTMTTFDNNPHALGLIFDDKYATYTLLKELHIPVIEHQLLYAETNQNDYCQNYNNWQLVDEFFKKHHHSIVLKANHGYGGKQVFHITNLQDIKTCLESLFLTSSSVSMCPFYQIKYEYRVIVIDNKIELIYQKIKPVVIGDGKSSLKELLIAFNEPFFKDYDAHDANHILKPGEVFEYNWQFNLSKGAILSLTVDDAIKNQIVKLVKDILKQIEIGFATIDIVELDNRDLMVMEINSGVGMNHFRKLLSDGREISKKVYKKAIMKLFNLE